MLAALSMKEMGKQAWPGRMEGSWPCLLPVTFRDKPREKERVWRRVALTISEGRMPVTKNWGCTWHVLHVENMWWEIFH